MEWTVLEAEAHIGFMKNNLADGDIYLSSESCSAIAYLIEMAKRYIELKAELENLTYKIQMRDATED